MLRRWRRSPTATTRSRILIGETYVLDLEQLVRSTAGDDELQPRVQLPVRALEARGRALRASSRGRGTAARERVAGVDGRQPRHQPASRRAGAATIRAQARARCDADGLRGTPFLYYGDEIGMPDADDPDRPGARPGRRVAPAPAATATPGARRCRGPASRARASPTPASSRGCRTATSPRATCRPARRARLDALPHARPDRACGASAPNCARGSYATLPAPRRCVGVAARRPHGRGAQHFRRPR